MLRTLNAADSVGIRALVLHAKNPRLADWYKRFYLEESPTDALHLFLPIEDIRAAAT